LVGFRKGPQRLKPRSYQGALRGAEAPPFHGTTRVLLVLRGIKIKVKVKALADGK